MNEGISDDSFQFEHPMRKHLKLNRFIFCPGCLIGSVITSITKTLVEKGLTSKDYAIVSGIGAIVTLFLRDVKTTSDEISFYQKVS